MASCRELMLLIFSSSFAIKCKLMNVFFTSHHLYANNCTVIRYNDIKTTGKPTTYFSLFRSLSGSN